MDYIRSFDIQLAKDVYYAGETLSGHVILENTENIKIRGIRVVLRGKAHAEWKIMKSGERRTVKDDQYLLDDKSVVWGIDKHEDDGVIPILPRGIHQLPFKFNLPQTALPCSFESKAGTIRYYIKVVIDIPYASPPQGIKYFTVIGPHIDCMEEKYLTPMVGQDKKTVCCLCCQRGPIALRVTLERTAYVCNDNIRLHAQIENQSDQSACVKIKLVQYVEYFIDKGVLGVNKNLSYVVLEHRSPRIAPYSSGKYDSTLEQPVKLPVVPPTLIGVCRLIQIYYVLKACLELEKSGDDLHMDFPFTVATVPFRIPNSSMPDVEYEFCSSHVEGGMYVSPEFQIGQVYDGTITDEENVLLYRPVYVRLASQKLPGEKATTTRSPAPATISRTLRKPGSTNELSAGSSALALASASAANTTPANTAINVANANAAAAANAVVSDVSRSDSASYCTDSAVTAQSSVSASASRPPSVPVASSSATALQTSGSATLDGVKSQSQNVQQVVVDLHQVRLNCATKPPAARVAATSLNDCRKSQDAA